MSVFGHTQIKSNENVYTIQETDANIKKRMPAGTIIMYAGKTIPEGFLMCNGGAYSSSIYPELYAVIGTTYGTGEGGTGGEDFNVPDLTDGGDDGNLGRFIRAATSVDEVGTKEADAIRNIRAQFFWNPAGSSASDARYGAIKGVIIQDELYYGNGTLVLKPWDVFFDANIDNAGNKYNPMVGHANGGDVHPYSMRILCLIAY